MSVLPFKSATRPSIFHTETVPSQSRGVKKTWEGSSLSHSGHRTQNRNEPLRFEIVPAA